MTKPKALQPMFTKINNQDELDKLFGLLQVYRSAPKVTPELRGFVLASLNAYFLKQALGIIGADFEHYVHPIGETTFTNTANAARLKVVNAYKAELRQAFKEKFDV